MTDNNNQAVKPLVVRNRRGVSRGLQRAIDSGEVLVVDGGGNTDVAFPTAPPPGAAMKITYNPDYCVAPGETILEWLELMPMTQRELAKRMGYHESLISRLIKGSANLTPATAIKLERILGSTARFWLNLELEYRLFRARRKMKEAKCPKSKRVK